MTEKTFFTINEFANLLKIHPSTVRRAIKSGKLQALRVGSTQRSLYRIPASEIERIALFDLKDLVKSIIDKEL